MDAFKRVDANELAGALGFEWDYENATDNELYDTLYLLGYEWDGQGWEPVNP